MTDQCGYRGAVSRLLCFPCAGGSSVSYRAWHRHSDEFMEVVAIEPPARGRRYAEAPVLRMRDLVDGYLAQVEPYLEQPYALFGHSLGALAVFELARRVSELGLPEPVRVFVAASAPPDGRKAQLVTGSVEIHRGDRTTIIDALRRLGGTPEVVLKNDELIDLLLPAIRADFEVLETYRFQPSKPLSVPLTALAGRHDPTVSRDAVQGWARHTVVDFAYECLPGGHFFPQDHADLVQAVVRDALSQDMAANSPSLDRKVNHEAADAN